MIEYKKAKQAIRYFSDFPLIAQREEEVLGDVIVPNATAVDLKNLVEVGGKFDIKSAEIVAPMKFLVAVCGCLYADSAKKLIAPNLQDCPFVFAPKAESIMLQSYGGVVFCNANAEVKAKPAAMIARRDGWTHKEAMQAYWQRTHGNTR